MNIRSSPYRSAIICLLIALATSILSLILIAKLFPSLLIGTRWIGFALVWLYPSFLAAVTLVSLVWISSTERYRGFHQFAEWRKLRDGSYWPKDQGVHKSLIVLTIHSLSVFIRCLSPFQYFKAFCKVRPIFRIDRRLQTHLGLRDDSSEENISIRLVNFFKHRGFPLSYNTRVHGEDNGRGFKWKIIDEDQDRKYIIRKEEKELKLSVSPFGGCKVKTLDDPAIAVEIYVLLWIVYLIILGCYLHFSQAPKYLPLVLFIILILHAVELVHSNLYYNLLRPVYYGRHRVHRIPRSIALLMLAYFELWLLFALIYLGLGYQFTIIQSNLPITSFLDAFYLSATTITTLGHGDILPDCCMVRILLGFQSLSGIALLGLGITRMLGLMERPTESLHGDGK